MLISGDESSSYPICAEPAPITRGRFRDIDEQAAQLGGHDQRYHQLSCGPFSGSFLTAALGPDEFLYLEETNQALLQQGGAPEGASSFMILLRENDSCRFQHAPFSPNDLAVIPAGSDFSVSCPANTGFCVITLNPRTMEDMALSFAGDRHARRLSSPAIGYAVQALRMLVRSSIAMVDQAEHGTGLDSLAHVRRPLVSTLDLALSAVPPALAGPPQATLFRRAMALVEARLDVIDVPALCGTLDVSRRTIEDVFRRELEMGPARVIKLLRLNWIRRDIALDQGGEPIADIAARWGLWHPSHFTNDYHATFGERPSDLRRRAAIPAGGTRPRQAKDRRKPV